MPSQPLDTPFSSKRFENKEPGLTQARGRDKESPKASNYLKADCRITPLKKLSTRKRTIFNQHLS